MPELPEVETIRRGLEPLIVGRRVSRSRSAIGGCAADLRRGIGGRLRGARLLAVHRRSKYLMVPRRQRRFDSPAPGDDGTALGHHGRRPEAGSTSTSSSLSTTGASCGSPTPRRFGMVEVVPTAKLRRHPLLRGLGPEPVGDGLDADALAEVFFFAHAPAQEPVKNFLMDTRTIAGVGNIYACEALHRAGLHPRRAVGRIARPRWTRVIGAVRQVLGEVRSRREARRSGISPTPRRRPATSRCGSGSTTARGSRAFDAAPPSADRPGRPQHLLLPALER